MTARRRPREQRRGRVGPVGVVAGRRELEHASKACEGPDGGHSRLPVGKSRIAGGEDREPCSGRGSDQRNARASCARDCDQRVDRLGCHLAFADVRELRRDGDEPGACEGAQEPADRWLLDAEGSRRIRVHNDWARATPRTGNECVDACDPLALAGARIAAERCGKH